MLTTKRLVLGGLLIALLVGVSGAGAQMQSASPYADKKALTLETAKKMAAAAEAEARKNNWKMVIAVVDDGGHLIYLERIDGTQTGSVRIAIDKARSAAAFQRPTKVFEDALAGGRRAILGISGAVPLEGGLPVMVGDQVVGAIGASGGTAPQDGQVAKAGLEALSK